MRHARSDDVNAKLVKPTARGLAHCSTCRETRTADLDSSHT